MNSNRTNDKNTWYKDAVIYELHIKAFHDGNCDGVGDFDGLMGKLDYLQDLGITAIWLLPFYPSPLRDDGYDIADYFSINPAYGNIDQFKRFLEEAHKRELKVITELVINHTSDQHPWFQRARNSPRDSPERNYYVWTDNPQQYKDARIIFQDFEPSNWSWDPVAQQYYWHRFFSHQPDLNYDNSVVQDEIFRILDYWCGMGVDGFRLDAIPYLFERDNTNCENLPETHAFLKKLRSHVDEKFPGTLLLAEANMWPEDSVSYFGSGDECQMNYHFPVMPRMFMAIQMEDKYPIIDIFDQTPPIPETCQWGIFLRNHDELTLEMVTDEERDYMYKVYVKDPKARINLGIRHRLAPLMENDRRRIELMNYLLFSLPGTPIIYYGDELGMGDNYYLGDRDGVRTPMQWSPDRNAGFSEANPQRLYLPVILDPLYHYDAVNVEVQSRNTSSLLWEMKRLISTRKKFKAFGRGQMQFVNSENPKILAFTRSYESEQILVVVNLSRHSQPVTLDMADYGGRVPVEVFSHNVFPEIKKDSGYFLTLSPYQCFWFLLKGVDMPQSVDLPYELQIANWQTWFTEDTIDELETAVLPRYIQKMRWFGGKAMAIESISIASRAIISVADASFVILLIEVRYKSGLPDLYQLAITSAKGDKATDLKNNSPSAVLCDIIAGEERGVLYDALYSEAYRQFLFDQMSAGSRISLGGGEELSFSASRDGLGSSTENIRSRVFGAEQSNSSVAYDNAYFLKLYRKVDRSMNPDVELSKHLAVKTHFEHIPGYIGDIQWCSSRGNMILAMMQEMVESNQDGWTFMLDKLNIYNERLLATPGVLAANGDLKGSVEEPVAYDKLSANLKDMLDPMVAERVRMLGVRTGEMHIALAASHDIPEFRPEEFSLHYQRSLYSSFVSQVQKAFYNLSRNIKNFPQDVRSEAEEILHKKVIIQQRFKSVYGKKLDTVKIRVHGDYHLGQTLFTGKDIKIIDFEGEPARSYSERRLKRNALKDVAGMMRSFHYAAYASLLLSDGSQKEKMNSLVPFAELWQHYMSGFFLEAYQHTVAGTRLAPGNKKDFAVLLEAYILEKAIYELNYELNNRPAWVVIPIRGIKAIIGQ